MNLLFIQNVSFTSPPINISKDFCQNIEETSEELFIVFSREPCSFLRFMFYWLCCLYLVIVWQPLHISTLGSSSCKLSISVRLHITPKEHNSIGLSFDQISSPLPFSVPCLFQETRPVKQKHKKHKWLLFNYIIIFILALKRAENVLNKKQHIFKNRLSKSSGFFISTKLNTKRFTQI